MKQFIGIVGLLLLSSQALAETGVLAEVPTMVELSNREINRIVCPGPLTDLIFSEEKGLTGHFSGNNAFIKFTAEEFDGVRHYPEELSELYLISNGAVYTLIAAPMAINAVTFRLAPPKSDTVASNLARFRNMPLEKQALEVIKEAYHGMYASGYRVTDRDEAIDLGPEMEVMLQESVEVDGLGLRLKTFTVTARDTEVLLDEKLFLSVAIGTRILGVAMEDHRLNPGASTRVFVVEQKAGG